MNMLWINEEFAAPNALYDTDPETESRFNVQPRVLVALS